MNVPVTAQDRAPSPEEAIENALRLAVQQHQVGQFKDAEDLYRAVLRACPGHPDANHNLAVLAVQLRQPVAALPFFEAALKANPAHAQYWVNYIDALIEADCVERAREALELARQRAGLSGATANALVTRLGVSPAAIQDGGGRSVSSPAVAPTPQGKAARSRQVREPGVKELNKLFMLFKRGRLEQAETAARSLIRRFPDHGVAWSVLGAILTSRGKPADAVTSLRKAVELRPDDAIAHNYYGNALLSLGRSAEAAECYRLATVFDPESVEAHSNLGIALHALGRLPEAERAQRRALELAPAAASLHNNLAIILKDLGNLDAALASCQRALELKPDLAEAHNSLGNILKELGRFEEAESCFHCAIELSPRWEAAYSNLGTVQQQLGRFDEAAASFRRALALKPDLAEAHSNLADVLQDLRQYDEAHACYLRALELKPDFTMARYGLGLLQLQMGDLANGWAGYEYRWTKKIKPVPARRFPQPWWEGQPLAGKRILIWGEQGIGDQLLWASMFREIIESADHCVIECTAKLVPLLSRSFPGAEVVAATDPPQPAAAGQFDYQCPMGSLARFLRPTLASFPRENRYLVADPARVAYWKERLASLGPGPKVGFAWRSGLGTGSRSMNYTTLEEWGPIFAVPGVHFVNLQYDECTSELDAARQRFGVPLHVFPEVDLYNDLAETAAFTRALDFVIASFTSVYPMAAGVGVPTCTMYSWSIGWATIGGEQIPWCPTLECYTRRWEEPWDGPVTQVTQRIRLLAQAHPELQ